MAFVKPQDRNYRIDTDLGGDFESCRVTLRAGTSDCAKSGTDGSLIGRSSVFQSLRQRPVIQQRLSMVMILIPSSAALFGSGTVVTDKL